MKLFMLCLVLLVFSPAAFTSKAAETTEDIFIYGVNPEGEMRLSFNWKVADTLTSVTIPNTVTYNDKEYTVSSFYGSNTSFNQLTHVTIEEGVKTIENFAFRSCPKLKVINIPSSVSEIGKGAFQNTQWLKDKIAENPLVVINNILIDGTYYSERELRIPGGVKAINVSAFDKCDILENVVFPVSITKIGANAFAGCTNLEKINLPDSITEIGNGAFKGCTSITEVKLSKGIKKLPGNLFNGCTSIKKMDIPSSVIIIEDGVFSGNRNLTQVVMTEGLEKIGVNVFNECTALEKIEFPDSVTEIGFSAFKNCAGLKEIKLPENLISISDYLFFGCSSLNNLVIPEQVTKIGYNAFLDCTTMDTISIPKTITDIRHNSFEGTIWFAEKQKKQPLVIINNILIDGKASTGSVVVPQGVIGINEYAFYNNTKIKTITFPSTLKTIQWFSFSGCSNLEKANILNKVTNIGSYAFNRCKKLKTITIPANTKLGSNVFGDTNKTITIFCKKDSYAHRAALKNGYKVKYT